jgi:hypothetical protein
MSTRCSLEQSVTTIITSCDNWHAQKLLYSIIVFQYFLAIFVQIFGGSLNIVHFKVCFLSVSKLLRCKCEKLFIRLPEGLLEEASSLLNSGLQPSSNSATRSIGYQLVRFVFELGFDKCSKRCRFISCRRRHCCVPVALSVHFPIPPSSSWPIS